MRHIHFTTVFVLAASTAYADNDMSTAGRAGTIAAPDIDESTHNPSTVGVNQGRASYQLPMTLPPGHPNLPPSLSIRYSGGRNEGVVGAGWSIAIPQIRVRRIGRGGQPRYGVGVTYLAPNGEALLESASTVPDVDGDGVDETEFFEERNSSRSRYLLLSAGGWRIQHTDGTQLTLGTSSDALIAREGYSTHIATWLPEKLTDRSGNEIRWTWASPQSIATAIGDTAYNETQRYLTEMRWACQDCDSASTFQSVTFVYESRAPHVLDFSAGFLIETEFRVAAIKTWTTTNGNTDAVLSYTFDYGCSNTVQLLCSVQVHGADGLSLPATTFSYTSREAPASAQSNVEDAPTISFDDGIQIIDVDMDGRGDVVDMSAAATSVTYAPSIAYDGAGFSASNTVLNSTSGKLPGASLSAGALVSAEDTNRSLSTDLFDLAPDPNGSSWIYPHNKVDGWGADAIEVTLPAITASTDTLRIDIDRNGYPDLVDTSVSPWVIYLDDGTHTFSEVINLTSDSTPTFGAALNASTDGVIVGDVNGDGFVDIVYLDLNCGDDHARVWFGRGIGGFGWFEDEDRDSTVFSQYSTYPIETTGLGCPVAGETSLADIDGDGFDDLVTLDSASGYVRVWLNNPATGFDDNGTGSPFAQTILASDGCRLADFDNDAITEVMCSDDWQLFDFANQKPFLLASVANGRGRVTRIGYTTSAREQQDWANTISWERTVSMVLPVVKTLEVDDSRGNVLVTTHRYRDPYYLQDPIEERYELMGFGYIEQEQSPFLELTPGQAMTRIADPQGVGSITRTWFDVGDTDYFARGVTLCEELWDTTTPAPNPIECGKDGALERTESTYSTSLEANSVTWVVTLDAVDSSTLDGNPAASGVKTRVEYEYDSYGNRTITRYFGDVNNSGDEKMMVQTYVHNPDLWIVSLPRSSQHGGMDLSTDPPSLELLLGHCTTYDGNSPCNPPTHSASLDLQVVQGLPTGKSVYTDDDLSDATPGAWTVDTTTTFTASGMPASETNAVGDFVQTTYDPDFGLFAHQSVVDPGGLNLVTTQVVDPHHGVIVSASGPDGVATLAAYDSLGRFTKLVRKGDTLASPTEHRTYAHGSPLSTVTVIAKDGTTDGLQTLHIFDGASRRLCSHRETFGSNPTVTFQREYNALGQPVLDIQPLYASGCDSVGRDSTGGRTTSRAHRTHVYDSRGRMLRSVHSPSAVETTVSYDLLKQTQTDEAGRSTTQILDGLSRVIEVIEHIDLDTDGTTEDYRMKYTYDPLGQLTSVTDALTTTDHIIYTARFDSRGRLAEALDASRGLQTWHYDAASRLVRTVDARGHKLEHTYDRAGRLATREAIDAALAATTTTFTYDNHPLGAATTASCNSIGRLTRVEDDSGETTLCYDSRGRRIEEKVVIDLYSGLTEFTTSRTFDAIDRLARVTYPDNVVLTYGYDNNGRPDSLDATSGGSTYSLITSAAYTATDKLATLNFGNGGQSTVSFDSRLRPSRLQVWLGSTAPSIDLSYNLDPVGNLLNVVDPIGDRSATYTYDGRYRLTSASGDFAGGETLSYSYDMRGNLTARTNTATTSNLHVPGIVYAPPGGTAPLNAMLGIDADLDGVADVAFSYDASGNLAADSRYSYTFDPYGKLNQVENASGVVLRHIYDYQRRRVATERPASSNVYFVRPANMEVRFSGGAEVWRKHITFAGTTIGIIDDAFAAGTEADHIFLSVPDIVGSPIVVMDVEPSGPGIIEQFAAYPFGAENDLPTAGQYYDPANANSKLSLRFQGRELDSEHAEFYNFGARVYRSDFARFMSADTVVPDVGSSESWNRYSFVRNRPLTFTDPTGNSEQPETEETKPNAPTDTVTRCFGECPRHLPPSVNMFGWQDTLKRQVSDGAQGVARFFERTFKGAIVMFVGPPLQPHDIVGIAVAQEINKLSVETEVYAKTGKLKVGPLTVEGKTKVDPTTGKATAVGSGDLGFGPVGAKLKVKRVLTPESPAPPEPAPAPEELPVDARIESERD